MRVESEVTGSCLIQNPDHLADDTGPFLDCFPRKICPIFDKFEQVAVLKRQAEGLLKSMKINLMNELWNSTVVAFWVQHI